jgi:hypothetical protein
MQLRSQGNLAHLLSFSHSWNTVEKILLEKYDKQKVQGNTITKEEIRDILPAGFVWQPNDMFSKNIGDIFFSYAQKFNEFNDLKFGYNFKKRL